MKDVLQDVIFFLLSFNPRQGILFKYVFSSSLKIYFLDLKRLNFLPHQPSILNNFVESHNLVANSTILLRSYDFNTILLD